MRIIDYYYPISPTFYITMEHEDLEIPIWKSFRVLNWTLEGTDYKCRLVGGPTIKSRGYTQRNKAYNCYKSSLEWYSVPTKYETTQVSQLGPLEITGFAHHPISDSGVDVLFFTLASGSLGFCEITEPSIKSLENTKSGFSLSQSDRAFESEYICTSVESKYLLCNLSDQAETQNLNDLN